MLGVGPVRMNIKTTWMSLRILFMTCSRCRVLPLIETLQPPQQKAIVWCGVQINVCSGLRCLIYTYKKRGRGEERCGKVNYNEKF
eukprot:10248838-Ditylum_brightwellii.AAC.1